ncbi:hypothetical protein EGW08_013204 [Elysia chlorotica]|uniref:Tyrosine-protein phosphatase domain-containing protein n=1 Tax=Elysia chlorotica TaxID=188477 RepID=A0A433TBS5_ELYCH|nr:hypothetical protein EGW08_013204 [Elysia chlorotica]
MGKYINAVLVPTLSKDRQDILTQLPLPSTVTDFWRLVTQYHVGLVVAFDTDSRHTDETVGEFLPASEAEPMRGALFEIQARWEGQGQLWTEVKATVFKKRKSLLGSTAEQHHVTCLLCKDSRPSTRTMLEYLRKIKSCRPPEQSRTLYMCRNGADLCGLVCVQSILLDRLDTDQCVSVPLVVGAIRAIRPQVIPTLDQYRSLYSVLKLVQDSSSVYGNVSSPGSPAGGTSKQGGPGTVEDSALPSVIQSIQSDGGGDTPGDSSPSSPRPPVHESGGVVIVSVGNNVQGGRDEDGDVDVDKGASPIGAMQGRSDGIEYANM